MQVKKILNRLLVFFDFGVDENTSIEQKSSILFINVTSFFMLIICFIEGVAGLIYESSQYSGPLLALSFIYTINFLYIGRNFANSPKYKKAIIGVFTITMIYFIIFGGPFQNNMIWIACYPFVTISAYGRSVGSKLSAGIFALLILQITLFQYIIPNTAEYPSGIKLLSSIFYVFAFAIAYTQKFIFSESLLYKETRLTSRNKHGQISEDNLKRISHDINTSVNNIKDTVKVLKTTSITRTQSENLFAINMVATKLQNIADTLNSQRKSSSSRSQNVAKFNIYSTLNGTIKVINSRYSNYKFNTSFDAEVPLNVVGDEEKTYKIFLSILENLSNHIKNEEGRTDINISLKSTQNSKIKLQFKIVYKERIPFPKAYKTEGMVSESLIDELNSNTYIDFLRLNFASNSISEEGGKLVVKDKEYETVILFDIEFWDRASTTNIKKTTNKPITAGEINKNIKHRQSKSNLKDARILLVEDNFSNQQITILYLKNEVQKIDVAFNGKEAIEKFNNAQYDLILMDVKMPIMNGIAATRKIRATEKVINSYTPIIALVANAFPEDKERCLLAGMDDYINKPFQPNQLISKIKEYIN